MNIFRYIAGLLSTPFSKTNPHVEKQELNLFEENVHELERTLVSEEFVKLVTIRGTPIYHYIEFLKKRDLLVKTKEDRVNIHGGNESDSDEEDDDEVSDSENDRESNEEKVELTSVNVDQEEKMDVRGLSSTMRKRNLSPPRSEKIDSMENIEIPIRHENTLYSMQISRSLLASYSLFKDLCSTEAFLLTSILINKKKETKNTAIQFTNLEKEFEEAKTFMTNVNNSLTLTKSIIKGVISLQTIPEELRFSCEKLEKTLLEMESFYNVKLSKLNDQPQLPRTKEEERNIVDESSESDAWIAPKAHQMRQVQVQNGKK